MATPNYQIDYNDERFQQVEAGKKDALSQVTSTYEGMINQTDKYYQDQIDAAKDWANTQQQIQQDNTNFTIEQINQQKDQAQKDYTKEQSGAYVDWQKQSNQYGAAAEQMAAQGLQGTGYSESSQVSMYNTYQNRVAMARETYNNAVLNYNNAIKDAQLQNNAKLAEIAYQALQTQLELSLEGFQYKNQLLIEQQNQQREIDSEYYDRYLNVLNQMNTENALAEEVRQYNENLALQREQLAEEIRQYEQSYALQVKQYNEQIRQFDAEMARLKEQDKKENEYKIKQLELQKQQLKQEQSQWEKEYKLAQQELAEKQRQFDKTYAASQKKSSSSSSSSSSVKKSSGSSGSSGSSAKKSNPITKASQMSTYAQGVLQSAGSFMMRAQNAEQRKQAAEKVASNTKLSDNEKDYILKSMGF